VKHTRQNPDTQAVHQTLRTGHGCICRCAQCGGLRFQFGNLSAHLEAEAFLRLADKVHEAATEIGPKLEEGQRVVIPFASGCFSLLVDAGELDDLSCLMQQGLEWLEDREETPALPVN
jgi:hypothetical protein